MKKEILKVLVGSRAHDLHNELSDYDYRGVFVLPTSEILSLNYKPHNVDWIEGDIDNTGWEIGHFLKLATKCNPTILETFLSPTQGLTKEGTALRELFPFVWNSTDVKNAFIGYGLNQRKKFLENKNNHARKYAVAYLRTLYNAKELLETGIFTISMKDTEIFDTLMKWKANDWTIGEVIQTCYEWQTKVEEAYEKNKDKQSDLEKVNEFLLTIRKNNW